MPKTSMPRRPGMQDVLSLGVAGSLVVDALGDLRISIPEITWKDYVSLNDGVGARLSFKMIYNEGRLILLTESRKHSWFSRCLYFLVSGLAQGLRIPWEHGGSATYRKVEKSGGVEGDETFYFHENAERMKGPQDIDLDVQPPPDLAVEVGVSRSADDAVTVWGRLGVPEVWRLDPIAMECSFWSRNPDGSYDDIERSLAFPMLTPDDVINQLRLAEELGVSEWQDRLRRWVRKVVAARKRKGG